MGQVPSVTGGARSGSQVPGASRLAADIASYRARRPRIGFLAPRFRAAPFAVADVFLRALPGLLFFTALRFVAVRAFVPEGVFIAEGAFVEEPVFVVPRFGRVVFGDTAGDDVAASFAFLEPPPSASETRPRTTPAAAEAAAPSASTVTSLTPVALAFAALATVSCISSNTPFLAISDVLHWGNPSPKSRLDLL